MSLARRLVVAPVVALLIAAGLVPGAKASSVSAADEIAEPGTYTLSPDAWEVALWDSISGWEAFSSVYAYVARQTDGEFRDRYVEDWFAVEFDKPAVGVGCAITGVRLGTKANRLLGGGEVIATFVGSQGVLAWDTVLTPEEIAVLEATGVGLGFTPASTSMEWHTLGESDVQALVADSAPNVAVAFGPAPEVFGRQEFLWQETRLELTVECDADAADGVDSDGDGLTDAEELAGGFGPEGSYCPNGSDPHDPDTDGDGLNDGREVKGKKVKGKRGKVIVFKKGKNNRKARRIGRVFPDPCSRDTDGDGLSDRKEVKGFKVRQRVAGDLRFRGFYKIGKVKTDPTNRDTDGDGLSDKREKKGRKIKGWQDGKKKRRTDPRNWDTDYGGVKDKWEFKRGTDPTHAPRSRGR